MRRGLLQGIRYADGGFWEALESSPPETNRGLHRPGWLVRPPTTAPAHAIRPGARGCAPGLEVAVGSGGQRTDCAASIIAVARSFRGLMVSFKAAETISVVLFIWAT